MCTVTFIPKGKGQYILTSSRDEQTTRPNAFPPEIETHSNYSIMFPRDPKGGGTWIATANTGITVCLFNGAFRAHKPEYPYKKSRGLIVLDFFTFNSTNDFYQKYELKNIEPFTLVIADQMSLLEIKWDGKRKYLSSHDLKVPKIWSSVTLYPPDIMKRRKSWFATWKDKYFNPSQSEILDFHLSAGDGDKRYNIQMERPNLSLRTVSITSVEVLKHETRMVYVDLLNEDTNKQIITRI